MKFIISAAKDNQKVYMGTCPDTARAVVTPLREGAEVYDTGTKIPDVPDSKLRFWSMLMGKTCVGFQYEAV